jgi:hypothetical protein
MNKKRCPNIAIYLYAWAGQMKEACYDHGQAMMMLGNVMGSPVACREVTTEAPCSHPDDLVNMQLSKEE